MRRQEAVLSLQQERGEQQRAIPEERRQEG